MVEKLEEALNESDNRKFLNTFRVFSSGIELDKIKIKPVNKFFYFFNKPTKCNEFKFLEKIKNLAHKYKVDIQTEEQCFNQDNVK